MKNLILKQVQALKIILLIILLVIPGYSLKAADMSVGATAWYTAWDFEWDSDEDVSYDPNFLYGPVFSFSLSPDLNLSFVFLYGSFTQNIEGSSYKTDLKRYDSDLALNYRINKYFKFFGGVKYVAFTWADSGKHQAIGPGAGISSVYPLRGNLYLLGNFSGMYLRGSEDGGTGSEKDKANEYGFNTSISLAWYIPSAAVTISLGGRYQLIKIDYIDVSGDLPADSISKFYGATVSAVYSFNI